MQYVILGLLLSGPLSLYDVHKQFSAGISLFYRASFGSIQRALRQLVADGRVTVTDAPDSARNRKLYAVTPEGRQAWEEWMRAPVEAHDPETTMLAKVFLLGRLPEGRDRRAALSGIRVRLDEGLAGLRALAARLDASTVPAELRTEFGYQQATLDYGIRSHELALAWLDEVRQREDES